MSKNVHVVPGEAGWDVKVEGNNRGAHFRTQNEAIEAGRKLARGNRSEHIVHGRDGRIRQRDSYGRDPFPPRN
jgi:ketosteroid isomerase-like protein